jgi:hypothetical protein
LKNNPRYHIIEGEEKLEIGISRAGQMVGEKRKNRIVFGTMDKQER